MIAATLLFPQVGQLIERALARFSRRSSKHVDSGFLLGCALGFAFVPCGGPILAYVSAQSASVHFGFRPVALAIAYALGAGVVLFGIAVGGQRIAVSLRAHALALRRTLGAVIGAAAIALVFNLDTKLQTSVPSWTDFLQKHTEQTAFARDKLYGKSKFTTAQTPGAGTIPRRDGCGRGILGPMSANADPWKTLGLAPGAGIEEDPPRLPAPGEGRTTPTPRASRRCHGSSPSRPRTSSSPAPSARRRPG